MKILKCTTRTDFGGLKEGKEYQYLKVEHGIFETTPYVSVKALDDGKNYSCIHFHRFYHDMGSLKDEYKKLCESQPWERLA